MAFDYTNLLEVKTTVDTDFDLTDRAGNVGNLLANEGTNGEWCLGIGDVPSVGTGPTANPTGRNAFVYSESSAPITTSVWSMKRNISFDSTSQNVKVDVLLSLAIDATTNILVEYATIASPNETTDWTILKTIAGNGTADGSWIADTWDFSAINTATLWIRLRIDTNGVSNWKNDFGISTWREYGVTTSGINSITPSEFDYDNPSININGSNFKATQGAGKVYISDVSTLAGGVNEVEINGGINTWSDVLVNLNLTGLNQTEKNNLDTLGVGARFIILTNNLGDEYSLAVTTHRAKAIALKASTNIGVGGTTNTTTQLTPPATKSTADFGGGKISDDTNPLPTVNLLADKYREDEFSIEATTESFDAKIYEFRVLIGGFVADTISVTPQITIGASTVSLVIQDSLHNHLADNVILSQKHTLVIQNSLHSHIADLLTITQKNTLVVANSLHGHTANNTQLTSKNTLVVQDSLHSHSSANIDLIEAEVLTIQNALHSHLADNIALIQKNTLVVSNTVHTHIAENTILAQKNTLVIQNSLHSHIADNIVVSASITLVVQNSLHTHLADVLTLIQKSAILVQESVHTHIVDNVIITQKHTLVTQNSLHSHNVNNIDIVSKNTLVVQDTIHTHVSSNVALLEGNVLVIQSSAHSHSSENVVLLQANILAIDNTVHSHIVDNVFVVQKNKLVVQDSIHSHTVQSIVLGVSLVIQDSIHSHNAENINIIQSSILTIQDSTHTHVSEVLTLIQSYILGVQNSLHVLTSDNIVLGVNGTLIIQDSVHNHISDNIGLNQKNNLIVQESIHNHTVENIILSQSITLTIENGLHSHIVANIGLTQKQILEIQNSVHTHNIDVINLISKGVLEVQDSLHNHTSENIILIQKYILEVQKTIHNHIVDNLIVIIGVTLTNINSTFHSHTVDSLTIIILKFITMIGKFKTGATVTVDIYNLLDNSLVINAASMAEVLTTGYFKYKLTGITTPNQEFLYIMTDGVSQQSGKLIFRENLIGELEAYSIDDVWTENEKQEVLAYSQKSSNNAEQVNNKF